MLEELADLVKPHLPGVVETTKEMKTMDGDDDADDADDGTEDLGPGEKAISEVSLDEHGFPKMLSDCVPIAAMRTPSKRSLASSVATPRLSRPNKFLQTSPKSAFVAG